MLRYVYTRECICEKRFRLLKSCAWIVYVRARVHVIVYTCTEKLNELAASAADARFQWHTER